MRRTLFDSDHEAFRESFRTFLKREVVPNYLDWERDGLIPRELYVIAGGHGFLGMSIPEQFGGAGTQDFRFNLVIIEECMRLGYPALCMGLSLQNDLCLPYLLRYGSEEQKERWLPQLATGELLASLALTEPEAGSDLAAISTEAIREEGGYRVTGTKTFISGAHHCDLAITAVKTDRAAGRSGISMMVLESQSEGFSRGPKLEKLGLHSQDTAELFFDGVFASEENLLGVEGDGFGMMTGNLAHERLAIAAMGLAAAGSALSWTLEYVMGRKAFGRPIGAFQNSRFTLAEIKTEIDVAQSFLDACSIAFNRGELSGIDAAEAKWWCTDLQGRVVDRCVQLHGGYGYMLEYPITRAFADARITRIYGGANEIMKEIIGRSLGLR